MRRVSICGATETLLIDRAISPALLPRLVETLRAAGCELRGDEESTRLDRNIRPAVEGDWSAEYLAPILSVRVVAGPEEAIGHIGRYGTRHTEADICEEAAVAEAFLDQVGSAIVIRRSGESRVGTGCVSTVSSRGERAN